MVNVMHAVRVDTDMAKACVHSGVEPWKILLCCFVLSSNSFTTLPSLYTDGLLSNHTMPCGLHYMVYNAHGNFSYKTDLP